MGLAIYSGQTMSGIHGALGNTSGHTSIFTLITQELNMKKMLSDLYNMGE